MGAIGIAGIPYQSDGVAPFHGIPHIDKDLITVGVLGGVSIPVINHHIIAPSAPPIVGPVYPDYHTVFCGYDLGPINIGTRNINAPVISVLRAVSKIAGNGGKPRQRPKVFGPGCRGLGLWMRLRF